MSCAIKFSLIIFEINFFSLGGQTKAHYHYHQMPLVVSHFHNRETCCENDCVVKTSFKCPVNGCTNKYQQW